jgi:hypothetical protein
MVMPEDEEDILGGQSRLHCRLRCAKAEAVPFKTHIERHPGI